MNLIALLTKALQASMQRLETKGHAMHCMTALPI